MDQRILCMREGCVHYASEHENRTGKCMAYARQPNGLPGGPGVGITDLCDCPEFEEEKLMDQRITDAIEALGDARDLAENAGLTAQAEEFSRSIAQLREVDSAKTGLGEVYILKLSDLTNLVSTINVPFTEIYQVSAAIDGGLKLKINEGSWTPPMGVLKS